MPKYVIERNVPGVGALSPAELRGLSQKSNGVLRELGPDIQWLHSYVVDDKLYCVYIARNAELVAEHARRGNFPVDRITMLKAMIDPATGE